MSAEKKVMILKSAAFALMGLAIASTFLGSRIGFLRDLGVVRNYINVAAFLGSLALLGAGAHIAKKARASEKERMRHTPTPEGKRSVTSPRPSLAPLPLAEKQPPESAPLGPLPLAEKPPPESASLDPLPLAEKPPPDKEQ